MDEEKRIIERAEGAIHRLLKGQPEPVGEFQDEGIRYPRKWKDDEEIICHFDGYDEIMGFEHSIKI